MSQPWNERELDKRFDELKAEIKRLEAALTAAESRAQEQDALIGRLKVAIQQVYDYHAMAIVRYSDKYPKDNRDTIQILWDALLPPPSPRPAGERGEME